MFSRAQVANATLPSMASALAKETHLCSPKMTPTRNSHFGLGPRGDAWASSAYQRVTPVTTSGSRAGYDERSELALEAGGSTG